MTLTDAAHLARRLMAEHNCGGWTFAFDNARRRFGATHYRTRTLSLSRHLVALNDEGHVRDTILHEIAHILAGPAAAHGPRWRLTARAIGCTAARCSNDPEREGVLGAVVLPPMAWVGTCPSCGYRREAARAPKREQACGACWRFVLAWDRQA